MITVMVIMSIPAIAFGSFQYIYPSDPDLAYTKHGELTVQWVKFSENDNFSEYLGKHRAFDEDSLTADILVLRSYQEPQSSIYKNNRVVYSSVVLHQTVNCRNRTVSVQDLLMFSKTLSRGSLVKDLYDLDWDLGEATPGSIDEMKVTTLCGFTS
jgi:hypothetical protein